jgi:hypothetical protein
MPSCTRATSSATWATASASSAVCSQSARLCARGCSTRRSRPGLPKPGSAAKLASDEGKARYALRRQTVEPVFGQIKEHRGARRFLRRGLAACDAEWKLLCATNNLLKLWRHTTASTT